MKTPAAALAALTLLACTAGASTVNELELPDISAFAVGIETNVRSVETLDADALTDSLRAADARGETWTVEPLRVGLELVPRRLVGRRRTVEARYAPGEWEPGRPFSWVRVTVEDGGWLDDSVTGVRYVLWLVPCGDGSLRVRRALRAHLCDRPYWRYYSADPCP
ncbi:MAG: hypothetical protein GF405_02170 [Candidatus Eisenbacteria bacterium]|nr:hypothetical protein [Candidatus Eisenbacteria bacterium]